MGYNKVEVKFIFNLTEYNYFKTWYEQTILYGSKSFLFPQIDTTNGTEIEYQIADGGAPTFSNPSGDKIECSMTWETVK